MAQGVMALVEALPKDILTGLLIVTAILSYFLGCLNGAVIISKYVLHDDVRDHGSGNAGLTNFFRTFGGKLTFGVIAFDVIKMAIAMFVSVAMFLVVVAEIPVFVKYWAGLWCTLGHMFPCMFRFRGGKGILSGGTMALLLDWRIALVVWGLFFLAVFLTKMVSLGSCCGAIIFPLCSVVVYRSPSVFITSLLIGLLILWQHRGNIIRLIQGKETKLKLRKRR